MLTRLTVHPLATIDDWAVLPHGTVAVVRGQDCHVDWIRPDGPTHVTAKLPFAELPDYVPPIRPGAVRADLDGNL